MALKKTKMLPLSFISFILILLNITTEVSGHGRLVEPPSRSSMWRFGFKTKPNYNDNELFCGGYTNQWQRNDGKCGVCGDPWQAPTPRPNEAGGAYGKGIIVRRYKPGQVIKAAVDITANHMGFFEFKLCPHNSPSTVVSQDCLDRYLLELSDGSGNRYYPSAGTGIFAVHLKLPDNLKCTQCVFQWTYTAGNNWGRCDNGTSKVGCGPQETFRGCADVAIDNADSNDIPSYNDIPLDKPSISAIPGRTTYRPRVRPPGTSRRPYYNRRPSVTNQPVTRRRPVTRPPRPTPYYNSPNRSYTTRRPYNNRRPAVTPKRPITRPPRPTQFYNMPNRSYTTRRPTYSTRRPTYTRPTPYRRIYTPRPTPFRPVYHKETVTKKPRPTYKTKVTFKKPTNTNIETESGGSGGCRAVGVWKSISGIPSWCDSNCARGYCPSTHCDCS